MDKARLDAIRARCEAATVAPWKLSIDGDSIINESGQTVVGAFWHDGPLLELPDRNAEFIAAARTDVPDLLAEVEKLREQLEHADLVLDACKQDRDEWRRRAEKAEACITKMLQLMPIGLCKRLCKRAGVNCGTYGDCSPEWNGTT